MQIEALDYQFKILICYWRGLAIQSDIQTWSISADTVDGRFYLCKVSRRFWIFLHLRHAGLSYWDASPWRFPSGHSLLLTKKPSEVFEVLKWKKTQNSISSPGGDADVCMCVYMGRHLLCEVIKEILICSSNIHHLRGKTNVKWIQNILCMFTEMEI